MVAAVYHAATAEDQADSRHDRAALIAAVCAAFALTSADVDAIAAAILAGRTAAWASAYTDAAHNVGMDAQTSADATDPLAADTQATQEKAATAAAIAIAATYANDLAAAAATIVDAYLSDPAHEGESAAEMRAGVGQEMGGWAREHAAWKAPSVAQYETGRGADDGTAQLVSDLQDGTYDPSEWGVSADDIVVTVLPEFSSADECADYAGETYSLDDADEVLGLFPMHPFCVHSAVILVSGGEEWSGD